MKKINIDILRKSRIIEEKPYHGEMIHTSKNKYNRKKEKQKIKKLIKEGKYDEC